MTDKRIKSYLEDRLKRLESIRNERELTTAELGDIACCKQILAFINSLQEEPEPQFKVGDTIRSKHWNTAVHKIISMDDKTYCLDNGRKVGLPSQQLWELVEEPVNEDLEEACEQLSEDARKHKAETSSPFFSLTDYKQGVIDGAKWQKEKLEEQYELIQSWFEHIEQIATDRMTLIGKRMTDAHALDEIKCKARNAQFYINRFLLENSHEDK